MHQDEHDCTASAKWDDDVTVDGAQVYIDLECRVCGKELEAVYEWVESRPR